MSKQRGEDDTTAPKIRFVIASLVVINLLSLRVSRSLLPSKDWLSPKTSVTQSSFNSSSLANTTHDEYQALCDGGKRKCNIAVVACATSRNVANPSFDGAALVQIMLPSLLRTAETDRFSYAVYIGIGDDDLFWNYPAIQKQLLAYVNGTLSSSSSSSSSSGTSIGTRNVSFLQPKDGQKRIPMNEIANVAYQGGADYIVRINDDTEFATRRWATAAVNALLSMDPPNVGVVGPTCYDGKTDILTHDMVHRAHLEIFGGYYYPPAFRNWYLDDWITKVYGENRTKKLSPVDWEVRHHTAHHGTRYESTGDEKLLHAEVQKGMGMINAWFRTKKEAKEKC